MGVPRIGAQDAIAQLKRAGSIDPRALAVLASIDWDAEQLVLWIPGTSETRMPAGIRQAFESQMAGAPLVRVPYMQSWAMHESVPDGVQVLTDVLRGIAYLRDKGIATPDFLLSGHSQGSWVASEVLTKNKRARRIIRRAIVFSNPGTATSSLPGFGLSSRGSHGRFIELSSPHDPVAQTTKHPQAAIDVVGGKGVWTKVSGALKILVSDPKYAAAFVGWQIQQRSAKLAPGDDSTSTDPHQYTAQAAAAVTWLRDGTLQALEGVSTSTASWG